MSIKGKRVAFLGAGNMGEALIKGLTQGGLVPAGSISAAGMHEGLQHRFPKVHPLRALFLADAAAFAELHFGLDGKPALSMSEGCS